MTAIIVPVFNAPAHLRTCLDSLQSTLAQDVLVAISDDASTDPAIAEIIDAFVQRRPARTTVIRRQNNLGFVGNVNAAVAELPGQDFVLLNSDTVTSPGWLQQLENTSNSDPRIATITPWSNNAEICSFPEFCRAAAAPSPEMLLVLAEAALSLQDQAPPDLPTGVGFCFWVRRKAWDELSGFDASTFGRGYGEENDFCMRAAGHGWRNVLCPSAYVAHVGSASFSETGLKPGGENLARLVARYPDYNARVAAFIAADPLAPLRARLSAALNSLA